MCLPGMHGPGQIPAHPMTQPTHTFLQSSRQQCAFPGLQQGSPQPTGWVISSSRASTAVMAQSLWPQSIALQSLGAAHAGNHAQHNTQSRAASPTATAIQNTCTPGWGHLSEPHGMLKTALPQHRHSPACQMCSAATSHPTSGLPATTWNEAVS